MTISLYSFGIYVNFLLLVFICYKSYISKLISREIFYLFILTCLGPILFHNFVLVDTIFPDQGGYLDNIRNYRENRDLSKLRHADSSKYLSLILSIIPTPSVENLYGATFLNKFLLIFLFIYLIKFNYIKNGQAIILLLYPSLFLYSSLMLKETTIIFFLTITYILLIKDKFFYSLLCLFLVAIIKPHLSILFGVIFLIYIAQFKVKVKLKYLFYTISFLGIILFFENNFISNILSELNQLIYNFNLEDNNYNRNALNFTNELIKFELSSIIFLLSQILLFWVKPLFYNAQNFAQIIQSFENILVLACLVYYLRKLYLKDIAKTYYIILSALFVSAPYAVIVSNVGTLARYRFSIIFVFIIIIFIEINRTKKKYAR